MSDSDSFVVNDDVPIDRHVKKNIVIDDSDTNDEDFTGSNGQRSDEDDGSADGSSIEKPPPRKRLCRRSKRDSSDDSDDDTIVVEEDESDDEDTDVSENAARAILAPRGSRAEQARLRRQLYQRQVRDDEMRSVGSVGRSGEHKYLTLLNAVVSPDTVPTIDDETPMAKEHRLYEQLMDEYQLTIYDLIEFGHSQEYNTRVREMALDTSFTFIEFAPSAKDVCLLCQRTFSVNNELVHRGRVIGRANKACAERFKFLQRVNVLRADIATHAMKAKSMQAMPKVSDAEITKFAVETERLAQRCLNYSRLAPSMGTGKAAH